MHRWPRLAEAAVEVRAPAVGCERSRLPRAPAHTRAELSHTRAQARTRSRMACWARTHLRLPSPSPPALNPLRSEAIRFAWPRAARWVMPSSFIAKTPTGEPYSQPRTRTCTRVCFTAFSFLGGAICADIYNVCRHGCGRADAQVQRDGVSVRCDEPQVRTRFFFRVFRGCAVQFRKIRDFLPRFFVGGGPRAALGPRARIRADISSHVKTHGECMNPFEYNT